jgi:hypothetical protein
MPTIRYLGTVMPIHARTTLTNIPVIAWAPSDPAEPPIDFSLQIINSIISVRCSVSNFEETDLTDLYWRVIALVRVAVDLLSFSTGSGLTPIIHTIVRPNGKHEPLTIHHNYLGALCTAFGTGSPGVTNPNFDQIFRMVVEDPGLFLVLNDLTSSITHDQQALTNCARAMDGIRNLITPEQRESREPSWIAMRENLNLQKAYLRFISDASARVRHANRNYIPPRIVGEVYKRSWTVVNRYLEYRKGGNLRLSTDRFPLLEHDPAYEIPKP